MKITFTPLAESHFLLLLKWLETPHVKKWWDHDVAYTLELVRKKYDSYVKGYKLVEGVQKPIKSFIIHHNQNPVGYIQIYNAYDFSRSKSLLGLPENLGAFDIFIGEKEALQQGLGSTAISEFLKIHGGQYSHIFADPDSSNIAAIKAYEKAGFKKVSEQEDTKEVWMIKDLPVRNEPLPTIQKLLKERYLDAKAVFWAGSVAANQGTDSSDLDLVIVFESLLNAYREAFIYDGWPIDAFIHDLDTLQYFCNKLEANDGRPALINMILKGREILEPNKFVEEAKQIARNAGDSGPDEWRQDQIDKERFLITDILDDIKSPKNKEEQIISAVHLFEPLLQFYFRTQKKWAASGKSLMRLLKTENPDLAEEFTKAFASLVQTDDAFGIESAVTKILAPHSGFLWNGFRSDAPAEWKAFDENKILEELKSREPIFHHPEKFGITKQDIENQMCDKFWEVGASGKVYTKQYVIETLLDRYNDSSYQDIWEAKEFELTQIAADNYLLTYVLIQDKTRVTRRSTIWRRVNRDWKILYHQGTVIDGGKE